MRRRTTRLHGMVLRLTVDGEECRSEMFCSLVAPVAEKGEEDESSAPSELDDPELPLPDVYMPKAPITKGRGGSGPIVGGQREVPESGDPTSIPPWRHGKEPDWKSKVPVEELRAAKRLREREECRLMDDKSSTAWGYGAEEPKAPTLTEGGKRMPLWTFLKQLHMAKRESTVAEEEAVEDRRIADEWVNALQGRKPKVADWAKIYELGRPAVLNRVTAELLRRRCERVKKVLPPEQLKESLMRTAVRLDLPRWDREKLTLHPRLAKRRHMRRVRAMLHDAMKENREEVVVREMKPAKVPEGPYVRPRPERQDPAKKAKARATNRENHVKAREHWMIVRDKLLDFVDTQKGPMEDLPNEYERFKNYLLDDPVSANSHATLLRIGGVQAMRLTAKKLREAMSESGYEEGRQQAVADLFESFASDVTANTPGVRSKDVRLEKSSEDEDEVMPNQPGKSSRG